MSPTADDLLDKPSKTRPRPILAAPSSERDGKKRSLQRDLNPQQSPQRYQNKKKSSRSLVCWTHWYFIFAKFNTCTPLHIKLDKYLAARPFKLWYQNWHFPYCSSNEFNILKLKSNICHGIYNFFLTCMIHDTWSDTCKVRRNCILISVRDYKIIYIKLMSC